jgi:hypothetical protein
MNKSLEEILTELSKMDVIDVMEAMGGNSKAAKKFWNARRRGCTNGKDKRLCIECTYINGKNIYGKRACKSYKKRNNMKIGYFQTNKEEMKKILQNYTKKS